MLFKVSMMVMVVSLGMEIYKHKSRLKTNEKRKWFRGPSNGLSLPTLLPLLVLTSMVNGRLAVDCGYLVVLVRICLLFVVASLVVLMAFASKKTFRLDLGSISILLVAAAFQLLQLSQLECLLSLVVLYLVYYSIRVTFRRLLSLSESILISIVASISLIDSLLLVVSVLQPTLMVVFSDDFKETVMTEMSSRNVVQVFFTALVWGMILIGIVLMPLLKIIRATSHLLHFGLSCLFLVLASCIVVFGIRVFVLEAIGQDPFVWVLYLLFNASHREPLYLALYWIVFITLSVIVSSSWSPNNDSVSVNLRRKYFHFIAVAIFTPGYILDASFLHLSFSVAFSALLLVEYVRLFKVLPSLNLDAFFCKFLNEKDQAEPLIVTHLFLLVGCAMPVWLYVSATDLGVGLSGVAALGVGDAFASTVGKWIGTRFWPNNHKTVEGTAAFIISVFVFMTFVERNATYGVILVQCALTALLEAFCDQNDNLILPVYLFSLQLLMK